MTRELNSTTLSRGSIFVFKSDSEVETLIASPNNLINHKVLGAGNHGNQGNRNSTPHSTLTEEARARIGILASLIGDKATSELTGVARPSVTNLKNGNNLSGKPDEILQKNLDSRRGVIQEKALERVESFIDMLGSSDLSDDVKRSSIAERVANIFDKLTPKTPTINAERAQIIFYSPKVKESTQYPIIEVEAQNG